MSIKLCTKTSFQYATALTVTVIIFSWLGFTYSKTFFNDHVNVGGNELYYKFSGNVGPTVILDPGLGVPGKSYNQLAEELSEFSRVFQYDRLGLGKSDPIPQDIETRTTQNLVSDLHILLKKANIPGPYIYVAHSMAGYHARLYTTLYPDDIVGMVLIDVSHPDQFERILGMSPAVSTEDIEKIKSFYRNTMKPEFIDLKESSDQVRNTGPFGDLPLVVISAGIDKTDVRLQLQKELTLLSSNSNFIIAEESGHMVYEYELDLVVDAIRSVVKQVQ